MFGINNFQHNIEAIFKNFFYFFDVFNHKEIDSVHREWECTGTSFDLSPRQIYDPGAKV